MLDIAATVENRKTRLEWVRNVSSVIDIPLTVGGGISTLEDIEMVLESGADKVSMNSAAVKNPDLVKQASMKFGAVKITVAIEAKRNEGMPSGFELVVSGRLLLSYEQYTLAIRQSICYLIAVCLPVSCLRTIRRCGCCERRGSRAGAGSS